MARFYDGHKSSCPPDTHDRTFKEFARRRLDLHSDSVTLLGIAAGVLTTFSWLPQVIRCLRTGSARDFSWGYLAMFTTGVALWLVYGIARNDLAVTAANAVTLALLFAMIWLKGREAR